MRRYSEGPQEATATRAVRSSRAQPPLTIRQIWEADTRQTQSFGMREYYCPSQSFDVIKHKENQLFFKIAIGKEKRKQKRVDRHVSKGTYLDALLKEKQNIPPPWEYVTLPDILPVIAPPASISRRQTPGKGKRQSSESSNDAEAAYEAAYSAQQISHRPRGFRFPHDKRRMSWQLVSRGPGPGDYFLPPGDKIDSKGVHKVDKSFDIIYRKQRGFGSGNQFVGASGSLCRHRKNDLQGPRARSLSARGGFIS